MTTELLPQFRAVDLHSVRPFGRDRFFELVNTVLFYGIFGLGVLVPLVFAAYGLLFR